MNKVELLAPAGDLEKLKIAVMYGANAVFIGGKKFSLRARASNFDLETIKEGCVFAKKYNAKVYVTMNIVPHDEDFEGIEEYILGLVDAGVTGVLVSSMSYGAMIKKIAPSLELHLSTQQSVSNSKAINYFEKLGFSRVVLAREVGISQMREIRKHTNIELEVFIHGGMCVSYSGRCMLSNHMTNRDANRGGCAHSCRWNYTLFENMESSIGDGNYFNMGSKDLMAVMEIPSLIDMGISSLKIEGRMKSIYYVATVVRCYRMLIDEYYRNNGKIKDFKFYLDEIAKAENRLSATGFLNGNPGMEAQLYNVRSETPTKEFVGYVLNYDENTSIATVEQRNYFEINDELEVFGPNFKNNRFVVKELYDENMKTLDVARHPKQILKIIIPFNVEEHFMIRRVLK